MVVLSADVVFKAAPLPSVSLPERSACDFNKVQLSYPSTELVALSIKLRYKKNVKWDICITCYSTERERAKQPVTWSEIRRRPRHCRRTVKCEFYLISASERWLVALKRKEIAGEKILTPTSHSIHEANPTSVIKDFNSFQCIIFMRRNVYAILALQNVRLISENKQVEEDKDKASDNRNLSFKHSTCFLW